MDKRSEQIYEQRRRMEGKEINERHAMSFIITRETQIKNHNETPLHIY
jgi:hypothetical protein